MKLKILAYTEESSTVIMKCNGLSASNFVAAALKGLYGMYFSPCGRMRKRDGGSDGALPEDYSEQSY